MPRFRSDAPIGFSLVFLSANQTFRLTELMSLFSALFWMVMCRIIMQNVPSVHPGQTIWILLVYLFSHVPVRDKGVCVGVVGLEATTRIEMHPPIHQT